MVWGKCNNRDNKIVLESLYKVFIQKQRSLASPHSEGNSKMRTNHRGEHKKLCNLSSVTSQVFYQFNFIFCKK